MKCSLSNLKNSPCISDTSCSPTSVSSTDCRPPWEINVRAISREPINRQKRASKVTTRVKFRNKSSAVTKHNMSRNTRCHVLYAFPTFDKCDSLLFFPTTMAKQLNSGDLDGFTKLLTNHLHRECEIELEHAPLRFNAKLFVAFFDALSDIQPDRIMCVHSTKVVENEITASLYMKFTDCRELCSGVLRTITDESIRDSLGGDRAASLKEKLLFDAKNPTEQSALLLIIESQQDLTIYVRGAIRLTFDPHSKKVIKLYMSGELTSVEPVA